MATIKTGPVTLSTGTTVRVVDMGAGASPRYVLETPSGADSLGIERWFSQPQVTQADVIAMLELALGWPA